jgi:hypothetical protein
MIDSTVAQSALRISTARSVTGKYRRVLLAEEAGQGQQAAL